MTRDDKPPQGLENIAKLKQDIRTQFLCHDSEEVYCFLVEACRQCEGKSGKGKGEMMDILLVSALADMLIEKLGYDVYKEDLEGKNDAG